MNTLSTAVLMSGRATDLFFSFWRKGEVAPMLGCRWSRGLGVRRYELAPCLFFCSPSCQFRLQLLDTGLGR